MINQDYIIEKLKEATGEDQKIDYRIPVLLAENFILGYLSIEEVPDDLLTCYFMLSNFFLNSLDYNTFIKSEKYEDIQVEYNQADIPAYIMVNLENKRNQLLSMRKSESAHYNMGLWFG